MRNQANVSDTECELCAEPQPCCCPQLMIFPRELLYAKPTFTWDSQYENLPYTAQMVLADRENRRYDTLRIQRGKALEIFEFLGRVQGTLFRLQELYLGNKEMSRILQGDIARSIQRLHLVVEYLTPLLEKEEWKI